MPILILKKDQPGFMFGWSLMLQLLHGIRSPSEIDVFGFHADIQATYEVLYIISTMIARDKDINSYAIRL